MARRSSGGPAPRLPVWALVALALAGAVAAFALHRGGASDGGFDRDHEHLPLGPTPRLPQPPTAPVSPSSSSPSVRAPRPAPPPPATLDLEGIATDERDAITDLARAIDRGGPFAYRKDGVVFENREQRLTAHPRGHWREYTVPTPGSSDRGARRIVGGADGELFYTRDHYRHFLRIRGPTR